jgi:Family of unknown function (DUF5706)
VTSVTDQQELLEAEPARDRFLEFERAVLQDNIILCDAKSGVLLAFSGAMVIFCLDATASVHGSGDLPHAALMGLFLVSGAAFLASCHFALTTVLPRLVRGDDDHIFWESSVFKQSIEKYIQHMETIDPDTERRDKLRHLHRLAGICRNKFRYFQLAIRVAQGAFAILVAAELGRLLI